MADGNEWTPSQLKIPTYLMNFPFSMRTDVPNNVFMKENRAPLDKDRAYAQWLKLYQFIASQAFVQNLPSKRNFQDLPYVANIAMYLPHDDKQIMILSNYTSEPRIGEELVAKELFEMMDYHTVKSPFKFEGEAEMKYLNGNNYIVGHGMRTELKFCDWVEKEFGCNIIRVHMTSEEQYHLDCSIFPLTPEKTLVFVKNFNRDEIKAIEKYTEIIPVPENIYDSDPTNCVRMYNMVLGTNQLNGLKRTDRMYMIELHKVQFLENICAANGLELVTFNMSEFEKAGAALSCNVLNLNFYSYKIPIL
jgi:N-dimethylarginine dimethylaminohydrolase